PVTVPELWATICSVAGVDPTKRHQANPIPYVEANAQPIKEIVSPRNQLIDDLIRKLGSDDFPIRQQASEELEKFGGNAIPALRRAANAKLPLETIKRTEALIRRIEVGEKDWAEQLDRKWALLGRDKHR